MIAIDNFGFILQPLSCCKIRNSVTCSFVLPTGAANMSIGTQGQRRTFALGPKSALYKEGLGK